MVNEIRPLRCPNCGAASRTTMTRFGSRDDCPVCNYRSWDGKPMVSPEVIEARKHCHGVVDKLWKHAETMYGIPAGSDAAKHVRKVARNRAYRFIAERTGLPEPECHMSEQSDLRKLRLIYRAARRATMHQVREWAKSREKALEEG